MSKKPYRKKPKSEQDNDDGIVFDQRSMESLMADITRMVESTNFDSIEEINAYLQGLVLSGRPLPASEPETPLEEAQAIMYDAWDARTSKQRIRLARKALAISEDCADAYVLLAEEASSLEESYSFYEQGVRAGERALGPEAFTEHAGNFWLVLETRPYMRARNGLAESLWLMGRRAEAIDHYHDMLRLNPGDNQGIRYTLLPYLLSEGRDKDAERLLKAYPDDIAALWWYTSALLEFKKKGPNRQANRRLRDALEFNPHVPEFLLGRRRLPRELSPYMGFGDETEAAYYVLDAGELWLRQPGAIDWLRQMVDTPA